MYHGAVGGVARRSTRRASARSERSSRRRPYGPRRWAHRTRIAPSASSAPAASPAAAASVTRRPASTIRSRTGPSAARRRRSPSRLDPLDVGVAAAQHRRAWRPTSPRRIAAGELGDRAAEAVDAAQHDDAVADRRRGRRASSSPAGPTMSPSTAPASTEASWSGSPTRISRASAPTASTRLGHHRRRHHRRLVDDDDVVRQPVAPVVAEAAAGAGPPAEQAVERDARQAEQPLHRSPPRRRCSRASACTASSRRAAALPVGAASAIRGSGRPAAAACSSSRTTIRATVVVLPVPGPPATTANGGPHGGRCRRSLEVVAVDAEQPVEPVGQHARRRPRGARPARVDSPSAMLHSWRQ